MTLLEKIDRLLEIGGASVFGQRISAELAYVKSISEAKGNCHDALVQTVADRLLAEAEEAGGVITKAAALSAEETLMPLQREARSYRVHCISHAHIDMNWQWGYQETAAVTIDTFRTVLDLMKEYPDLTFAQSQASTYRIVEEHAPEMLEEIKARVREGRWEVSASTWVETDKNMPSGESLSRHILYTRRYLSRLLGIPAESMDLDFEPDTFGHAASVPEICKKGGIKYYYHCRGNADEGCVYRWRGPSGAELLVWREPVWYNYTNEPTMFRAVPLRCQPYGMNCYLTVYGVGDHGGGPTRRDVERLREYATWPLMPTILFSTYGAFFRELEAFRENLPVTEGELNFVFTGCYTSQSRIKAANHIAEDRMYEAELLSSAVNTFCGAPRRTDSFRKAWEQILFNQFHDILPGSGVIDTREYALGTFQHAMAAIQTNTNAAMRCLAESVDASSLGLKPDGKTISEGAGVGYSTGEKTHYGMPVTERGSGRKRAFCFYNATQYDFDGTAELTVWDWNYDAESARFADSDGAVTACKLLKSGKHYWGHEYDLFALRVKVPALGYAVYTLDASEKEGYVLPVRRDPRTDLYNDGALVLENERLRAVFDRMTMQIVSLSDLASGKELVERPSAGFRLIHENGVHGMSSWRVGEYMSVEPLNETRDVKVNEVKIGGVKQWITYEMPFGNGSKLAVTVSLKDGSSVLDFDVTADFHEIGTKETIPQLNFYAPVAYGVKEYRYDIPGGTVVRPGLHHDVPARSYGMALSRDRSAPALTVCSDSKYGFRGAGDALAVTLLRASQNPDPYPEFGVHHFRIGVGVAANGEIAEADEMVAGFLHPVTACSMRSGGGTLPLSGRFLACDGDVSVSAVKNPEDGNGLIVRLFDRSGEGSEFSLGFMKAPLEACETDLNEGAGAPLRIVDGRVLGRVEPHGVCTVLVRF